MMIGVNEQTKMNITNKRRLSFGYKVHYHAASLISIVHSRPVSKLFTSRI